MSREALRVYRWMWRELLRRRDGRVVSTACAFFGVAGADLARLAWLSVARSASDARRAVADITGPQVAAGAGRAAAAIGFCTLLFAPLAVAFVTSHATTAPTPREGEIRVLGAGVVLLDGDRLGPDALGFELASRGVRTVRVTVEGGAPAGLLADLRGVLGASGIDRVRIFTALDRPGGAP